MLVFFGRNFCAALWDVLLQGDKAYSRSFKGSDQCYQVPVYKQSARLVLECQHALPLKLELFEGLIFKDF